MSKSTIGIEISNIGVLKRIGDSLVSSYSDTDIYCDINESNFYHKLETPYRDVQYFASFTDAQYKSLIVLLKYLTAEYNIPATFLPEDKRYITGKEDEITRFKGIVSHVNYRHTDKWDLGPAFDWDRIINALEVVPQE